ncbi:MAG: SRPBCC family protein [Actinobacteria bacterium]|nr:MAG: SRPBCC family protein [Actinomycetota bacterium]
MQGEASVHMDAPVERVWDLVSDVTRIGEFSPETFEAQWTKGATGPAVGAWFKGHVKRNQRGPTYWTQCQVTKCEPNTAFEFSVMTAGRPVNTWGYRLQPAGGGTDVTEYFHLSENIGTRIYWKLLGRLRGKTNENGMRATLERMKAVVERRAA